jgi:hypothetical protein
MVGVLDGLIDGDSVGMRDTDDKIVGVSVGASERAVGIDVRLGIAEGEYEGSGVGATVNILTCE